MDIVVMILKVTFWAMAFGIIAWIAWSVYDNTGSRVLETSDEKDNG